MPRWCLAVALAAALLAAASGHAGGPRTVLVASDAEFSAAVAALERSGGTIALRPHVYRELVVGPRSGPLLRVVGAPGVRVERLLLDHAQRVAVSHVRVSPVTQDAWVEAVGARNVELADLTVTAASTPFRASIQLPSSDGVVIRRTVFSHCGDRSPEFVNCLFLRLVSHLTVEDSWFHDCRGCDFVHGRWGTHLTLRRNRFARALPCRMGGRRCAHQDLVELFSGQWLDVRGNRFGVYRKGGAQLYFTDTVDHVRIANNVFIGTDRRVPGYRSRVALIVGSWGFRRVPHDVRIVNNTILTGARRVDGYRGSIRMSSAYAAVPRRERPVLANNVIGLLAVPSHVCTQAGRSVSNVVLRGTACSGSDSLANPMLDRLGRPTAASAALLDRANRRYAPSTDITGRERGRAPDIGAYEFRP